jgi:hypothetical protein
MEPMEALRRFLNGTAPGPIDQTTELAALLVDCWDEFDGDSGAVEPFNHLCRIENARWEPPRLTFVIERHGATVLGSSRAELQNWTLDLDRVTREYESGQRQLRPTQPPLDVDPIADEIAALIENGTPDSRLAWYDTDRVRVLIGEIVPRMSAARQTVDGRRRCFWAALDGRLEPGWQRSQQSYRRIHS